MGWIEPAWVGGCSCGASGRPCCYCYCCGAAVLWRLGEWSAQRVLHYDTCTDQVEFTSEARRSAFDAAAIASHLRDSAE